MKKLIKSQHQEINGEVFKISQYEQSGVDQNQKPIMRTCTTIIRTGIRDGVGDITDETKNIIDSCKRKHN